MKIVTAIVFLLLTCSAYSQAGRQQNTSRTYFFWTADLGWDEWQINGEWKVCKTTDGGMTWDTANSPAKNMRAMFFLTDSIAFMNDGINETNNKLLKTTDRGITWKVINKSMGSIIHFLDEQNGYSFDIIEYHYQWWYKISKTTDGGTSWDSVTAVNDLNSWWVHKEDDITFSGGDVDNINNTHYGYIIRTTGDEYRHLFEYPVYGLCFIDSLKGFSSSHGKIYETNDGGLTWQLREDITGGGLVVFTDSLNGYIEEYSLVNKTTDGGKTWKYINIPGNYAEYYFYDYKNIYAQYRPENFYRSTDGGDTWIEYSFTVLSSISGEKVIAPGKFSLEQNYPNPFNPSTTIKYSLPQQSRTTIIIYDALEREITKLLDEEIPAGEYEVNWKAGNNPSGVYFCRMKAGNFVETRKLILIK